MIALPEMWNLPLRMGWSVIPLRARNKLPAVRWTAYQQRRADCSTVTRWAALGGNVGIVTGRVSGLLVLDLDNAAAIADAKARGIPDTVTATTAKGMHCYFAHPGGTIGNRAGIFPGADIRGDGGYVVAPGSIHPTGALYTWCEPPDGTALAPPPAWLTDALSAPAPVEPPKRPLEAHTARFRAFTGDCTPYGRAALDRESEAIRRAVQGAQETTLNNAALKIGALVAGKELTLPLARVELVRAGMCMPNHDPRNLWTLDGVVAKVDRALADGADRPRSAPAREPMEAGHG